LGSYYFHVYEDDLSIEATQALGDNGLVRCRG
jgi:hypothetical protein